MWIILVSITMRMDLLPANYEGLYYTDPSMGHKDCRSVNMSNAEDGKTE
jgi:hypothetical protein